MLEHQCVLLNSCPMTGSELLAAIGMAEKESDAASRALGSLRKIVEMVLQINGEVEPSTTSGEHAKRLNTLANAPKPLLKEWAVVCSHDPLLGYLIKARKSYARTNLTRGKGVRKLEVAILMTYQSAVNLGFNGSQNQWEDLLRMRG